LAGETEVLGENLPQCRFGKKVACIKLSLTKLQILLINTKQVNCGGGDTDDGDGGDYWDRVRTMRNYSYLQYNVAKMSLIPHSQYSAFIMKIISEIWPHDLRNQT
jgi:hypothetical protein